MISTVIGSFLYVEIAVVLLLLLPIVSPTRWQRLAAEVHLNVENQQSIRLILAQRNFYISGFSIFLTLIIDRLVALIIQQVNLLAQSEASMRQAQSATTAARSLLYQRKGNDEKSEAAANEGEKLIDDLKSERKKGGSMKLQAASTPAPNHIVRIEDDEEAE